MGLTDKIIIKNPAEKLHLKKREGHIPTAGATRSVDEEGNRVGTAAKLQEVAIGPAELGGRPGNATVPAVAAPGTPLNDPDTWEGPKVPPISDRFK